MLPPIKRSHLSERNALDAKAELEAATLRSASEGFLQALELSDVVLALAAATGARDDTDLVDKAALYARPLQLLARTVHR